VQPRTCKPCLLASGTHVGPRQLAICNGTADRYVPVALQAHRAQEVYSSYTQEQVDAIFKAAASAASAARIDLAVMVCGGAGSVLGCLHSGAALGRVQLDLLAWLLQSLSQHCDPQQQDSVSPSLHTQLSPNQLTLPSSTACCRTCAYCRFFHDFRHCLI